MHNDHHSIWTTVDNYVDAVVTFAAMISAYLFASIFFPEPPVSLTSPYLVAMVFLVALASAFLYQIFNLYRPTLYHNGYHAVLALIEVIFLGHVGTVVLSLLFARETMLEFFLVWAGFGFLITSLFMVGKRKLQIRVMQFLRKKRYRLRKIIIVGNNAVTMREYVRQITDNPEYGYMIVGYVGDRLDEEIVGCEKLGSIADFEQILDREEPSDVVFAIDSYRKGRIIRLVNMCDDRCITVYFLPVIYGFFKSPRQIEQIGTLPLINVHSTPLTNPANAFIKRIVDVVGSLLLIVASAPIMLIAAIGVKISSPGPIFFTQTRVGKLGKTFKMLKFRSMRVNAASDDAWTREGDPRKTRFGSFIRATAIDELPQLFNVLIGDMSLVGPRPEIPKFVDHFRNEIPLYMVKHYVKPGMTGLAQVRGLRGDTSVFDRIQTDISYIENWSLALDITILLQTPFKAFNKAEATNVSLTDPTTPPDLSDRLGKSDDDAAEVVDIFPTPKAKSTASTEPSVQQPSASPVQEDAAESVTNGQAGDAASEGTQSVPCDQTGDAASEDSHIDTEGGV